jgi:hypothetical protein
LFPFVQLQNSSDNIIALSPDGHWLATTHNNQPGGPDVYDLREGRHVQRLAKAELSGFEWQPQTGELVTQSTVEALFWQPGAWTLNRRLPWPQPGLGIGFGGFSPDGRTGWLNGPDGSLQFVDLANGKPYATLQQPVQLHGYALAFDAARQRVFVPYPGGIFA